MAPTRKSRSVNKRFSYVNEASPSKDGDAKKSMQRKRKLSDMLGSQWSKAELERFYEAYRKYGTDWKKVVAVVRNRSVEMVEALYTMNKAYLSLPEGTASVVGLIAMMTDHYSNLEGSDSEQESNDGTGTSQKSRKRVRSKFQPNTTIGSDGHFVSHSQPVASSSGFLMMSKKKRSVGNRARVVGKRTPRFPVSYSYEKVNGEKVFSATRQGLKLKVDGNDDDVAHEVALALAEASQKGGSPQVSQTPNRRRGSIMPSPIRSVERRRAELELNGTKLGSEVDEDGFEGSMEADNGDFGRERNYLRQIEVGTVEGRKGRRLHGRKLEVDDSGNHRLDDIKEACSGTEEGQNIGTVRGKLEFEVTDGKVARSTSKVSRKKSKKALFGRDEGSAFDALQTLADLSLMMPETSEIESAVQVKEDDDDDLVDRFGLQETLVTHQKDRVKSAGVKTKGNHLMSGFGSPVRTSKLRKASVLDAGANPEGKEESQQPTAKVSRKKQKISSKMPKTEAHTDDTHPSESQDTEARDEGKKVMSKGKRSGNNSSQKKQGKSVRHPELSSSTDLRGEKDDSSQSLVQVPETNQVNLPTKVRSRRKMEPQKPQNVKDSKFSDKFLDGHRSNIPICSVQDGSLILREKLSNCLSNHRLRRWCAFEWFYSAVDYPWFAKREFVEYLNHVGLGHVPRLTRVEWGVIRSSLGKPRRFSEQFLKEEKEKLNQYRDSVRAHYTELREGTREGLPTDLARPLSVGQRVIAIHPRTREIHDGNVLTVDHSRCRVQFDRPELGVEFVLDVDCMPLNPSENMPASLAKNLVTFDKLFENFNELKMNGWAKDQKLEGHMKFFPGENLEHVDAPSHMSSSTYPMSNLLKQAKGSPTNPNSQAKNGHSETGNNQQTANSQPSILAQIQAKEADVQALAELTRALEKKEAVVAELRHMNDDVLENQKDGDNTLKDTEPFKKQYAAVLVQLNEVNEQVSSALYCLRQRNTYQGSSPLARLRTTANLGDSGGPLSSFDQPANHLQESGPHVHDIVESSRTKARTMVDAAMQAITSSKAGGNTFERIEDAIDYVSNRLSFDDSCLLAMRHTAADAIRGSSASHDLLTFCCPSNSLHSTGPDLKNVLDRNEAIPSELISHCVATLLMIQKCTEREFPPADVAVILDSAVTSLQPCCSQNLPVYAEIQKCMGIIKNQILALVPT